jgi:hypothetical protein
MLVETAPVQNQLCSVANAVRNKSDLGINNLEEIVVIGFRKDLDFRLPGRLLEEMITFARNRQNEVRRELITSDVAVEDFRGNDDLFVLLRRGASPSIRFP